MQNLKVGGGAEFQQRWPRHFDRRQAVLPETSQTRSYLGLQQAFSAQGLSQMVFDLLVPLERRWW
jgi:hypothetical protein